MVTNDKYKSTLILFVSDASDYINETVITMDGERTSWQRLLVYPLVYRLRFNSLLAIFIA